MDKKIAGLAGALAAAALTPAQAAPGEAPQSRANAYAQLLAPIPGAAAKLQALHEAERALGPSEAQAPQTQLAQYWGQDDDDYWRWRRWRRWHHHHHHHHDYYGRPRWHHHHHHHNRYYYW
jgi:hypothetical protein